MTNLKILMLFLMSLALFSCGGDDEEPETLGPLKGTIDNISFTAGDASFEESTDKIGFEIFSTNDSSGDACQVNATDVRIFFTADNLLTKQDLFLDLQNFEGFTITLFNPDGFNNIIATEGYFRIIENDGVTIKAEMDIQGDLGSQVVGEFTATRCN